MNDDAKMLHKLDWALWYLGLGLPSDVEITDQGLKTAWAYANSDAVTQAALHVSKYRIVKR